VKLAVLTNILTPYRLPLFAALSTHVGRVRVFVMAAHEENRAWELPPAAFEWELLPGWHLRLPATVVSLHLNRGVGRALRRFDPDVVLSGGFAPANVAAWLYCRRRGRPFINWGELSQDDVTGLSGWRRTLRRMLIAGADGAIASSSGARSVFLHYGARPQQVLTAVMPIDVEQFHTRARAARATGSDGHSGYSGPVLMSVGRLVDHKGWRELFAIYGEILGSHPHATLLIAGDGPRRSAYEAEARGHGWCNVRFLGFQQAGELARSLALVDVFIFPSLSDPFGAVLAEAMAAELPVVSSIHAGATLDLVDDGVTGFRIEPRDAAAAAAVVRKVLALSAAERAALGARAYLRVKQFDIGPTAEAMAAFLTSTANTKPATNLAS
jgi:glycosyltransferase involved in cell wall biosynthesis